MSKAFVVSGIIAALMLCAGNWNLVIGGENVPLGRLMMLAGTIIGCAAAFLQACHMFKEPLPTRD